MRPSEVLQWSALDVAIAMEAIRAGSRAAAAMVEQGQGGVRVVVVGGEL